MFQIFVVKLGDRPPPYFAADLVGRGGGGSISLNCTDSFAQIAENHSKSGKILQNPSNLL